MRSERSGLLFHLNGAPVEIEDPDPALRLIDYLRTADVGLTGTKLACGEGGCGACTVALTGYDPVSGGVLTRAVNACLRPLCAVDGMAVTTTEGLGSLRSGLDRVQSAIAGMNGSQCGFCTPGFVMSIHSLLEADEHPSAQRIEDSFDGHICRCTGYRPILRAARTFAGDRPPELAAEKVLEYAVPPPPAPQAGAVQRAVRPSIALSPQSPASWQQNGVSWIRPASLAQAQKLKESLLERGLRVQLVVGNTTSGLSPSSVPDAYIDIEQLPELCGITLSAGALRFGASTTIAQLVGFLDALRDPITPRLRELAKALRRIASVQVRNAGSVAGNIVLTRDRAETDSPFPSDAFTALLAIETVVEVASSRFPGGVKTFPLAELPATSELPPDALVEAFCAPAGRLDEHVASFKIASRAQDAHAIVAACFRAELRADGLVQDAGLVLTGIAALPFRLVQTEAVLRGAEWDEPALARALETLAREVKARIVPLPTSSFLPAGYRESLARSLLYKFFVRVAEKVDPARVAARNRSAGTEYVRPLSHGEQHAVSYPDEAPVGQPIINRNAFAQATGEAEYTQDKPLQPPGRHAAPVLSRRARARFSYPRAIQQMELEIRGRYPSVDCIVTAEDVAGENVQGLGADEPVFAEKEVVYDGQLVALVVGRDLAEVNQAADWLGDQIAYTEIPGEEPILTIEEALELPGDSGLLLDNDHISHIAGIVRAGSDVDWLQDPERHPAGWRLARGRVSTPAQVHFYMETQTCIAVPIEERRVVLYSSSQNPNNDQIQAATILGIPTADVQTNVRRIGGGFGGKQLRSGFVSAAAALAASKVGHPVRLALTRQQDMRMTGTRHPFRIDYVLAYTEDGRLTAARFELVSDGGCSRDCSFPVMDLSQQHADGGYFIETFGTTGRIARTNRASNTAFRSFGIVQVTLASETAIEHAAHELAVLPEELRSAHLYEDSGESGGQRTHFGQRLEDCTMRSTWSELARSAEFAVREKGVRRFNQENRWRKRGISMIPLKYGVGYQPRMLDQGNAFVTVYAGDGSVLVQHGGVEMGQGMNTKMVQIAALALGIPMERIRVGDTWTGSAPNASATAASTGTDLNGAAVRKACLELRRRLEAFAEETHVKGWKEHWSELWPQIVSAAYAARVDLSSHALFRVPHLGEVDKQHPYGHAFAYFVYAAACSEVEIDVLTGETTVLRSDILYGAGKSVNPCLDVGQVEGAFVQGLGMMLTEEQLVTGEGRVVSDGTWEYKPPCSKTIPVDFRVTLVPAPPDVRKLGPTGVDSSKGVGEPAFVLAVSAFLAVRHAIASARRDAGSDEWFRFDAPATPGAVQSACLVDAAELTLARAGAHEAEKEKP